MPGNAKRMVFLVDEHDTILNVISNEKYFDRKI